MKALEISFRRGIEHNYLIITDDIFYDDYQIHMLIHNEIDGFLKLHVNSSNDRYEYSYEISSLQPIGRIYEHRQLSYDNIAQIIRGIIEGIRNSKEYLLSEDGLLISPEYLYADVESLEIGMIHFVSAETTMQEEFMKLSEFILDRVDHQDNKAVMLAYDLFKVVKQEAFVLADVESVLNVTNDISMTLGSSTESYEKSIPADRVDEEVLYQSSDDDNQDESRFVPPKKKFGLFQRIRKNKVREQFLGTHYSDQETSVYDDHCKESRDNSYEKERRDEKIDEESTEVYGKTVLLSRNEREDAKGRPRLVTSDGKKEYGLEHLPVTIGKSKELVDIAVKDNSVSRMHASIILEDGRICIKDLGSSNGTFVNSVMVDNLAMPLENEDEISLGRADFIYYCQ